jgi:hypothetical protein
MKFWEELIDHFHFIAYWLHDMTRTGFSNSSIVSLVFVASGTCLLSRCLAKLWAREHARTDSKVISEVFWHFFFKNKKSRPNTFYKHFVALTACFLLAPCLTYSSIMNMEATPPPKPKWTIGRHYMISHNTVFSFITAERTSHPTLFKCLSFHFKFPFEFCHVCVENKRYSSVSCKYSCNSCCVSCHLCFGCSYAKKKIY